MMWNERRQSSAYSALHDDKSERERERDGKDKKHERKEDQGR